MSGIAFTNTKKAYGVTKNENISDLYYSYDIITFFCLLHFVDML
jgi:hypothetical protein